MSPKRGTGSLQSLYSELWTGLWTHDRSKQLSLYCLTIMLSAISASGVERIHGFTQTGEVEDYFNTTINSNLFGKCLISHNNSRVKLVRTWCDVQLTLYASCYLLSSDSKVLPRLHILLS